MSIFDNHASPEAIEECYNDLLSRKERQEDLVFCFSYGATVVETPDIHVFIEELEHLINGETILCDGVLADRLKQQQGRQIIRWDVKSFRKYDAIGSMYKLSKYPKENKPIVIIQNITDIPDGDRSVYDDPVLVENILLRSWKNDTIYLTHHQYGSFELNRNDYSVIFPVLPNSLKKLHSRLPDGIGVMRLSE